MPRRATVVLVSALVISPLTGCRAINVSSDYSLDAGKTTGLAVVSLTMAGLPSSFNVFVDFRGLDVDHESSVPVTDLFASSDWDCPLLRVATDEAPCGRLAVIELEQGEYEFYSWQGGTSSGPGGFTSTVESVEDFSKRFKVLAGKAVYLGNIHFSIEQPPFGIGMGRYRMTVADQQARDLPLLHSKYPLLTPAQVVVDILE